MGKLRARFLMSFRAKLLAPVIGVVLAMLAATVWVVNQRITRQLETEARRSLATAGAVFQNSQSIRDRNLLLRFRNLPNEPRYKAVFQKNDPDTTRENLGTLLVEQGVDVVLFTPLESVTETGREPMARPRDPLLPLSEFASASSRAVQHALNNEEKTDTIRVQNKLYSIVSIPVFGVGRSLIGALTLGQEIGSDAMQEFSLITGSQIVLLAEGEVIVSSVTTPQTGEQFAGLFRQLIAAPGGTNGAVSQTMIGSEHYFCSAGRMTSLGEDQALGFLLLTSYEQSLQALHATKQALLWVSLLAVVLGSAVVWYLVRWVTQPLQELRDSAEAVGQGDFTVRVAVRSQDECGELAQVFNQMTENLKQSREQLELTVETLKTTQAQLIQSEKLSGIGEFVAGVAHELNNPLTSVMGFSELLAQADTNPQHKRHLEMIHKSAQRCQKIVKALLSFARRHKPERKAVCLNGLVEAALEILHYQLRTSGIEVTTTLDPSLPQAMVDAHQIQQVFLNIINNARQAIEAHAPHGWIKIATCVRGDQVRVSIQDSGPGIPPESLSKIFDPFFTTKEVGQGTGLGLSLCYGIIKEHGGTITPRSRPGEGATFIIELPITHETATNTDRPARVPETETVNPHEGQGRRVLVIDDEEPILHMVRDALTCCGYQVDVAPDGETGLRRLSQKRYDVTLCDWKMPGMSGQEVFERVRLKDRALSDRIIFITGDVVNEKTRHFLEEQKRVCLPKPFSLAEFREAIARMLAGS